MICKFKKSTGIPEVFFHGCRAFLFQDEMLAKRLQILVGQYLCVHCCSSCLAQIGNYSIILPNSASVARTARVIARLEQITEEKWPLRAFEISRGIKPELPVLFGALYGLRRSEAIGLKWDTLDFGNDTMNAMLSDHGIAEAGALKLSLWVQPEK